MYMYEIPVRWQHLQCLFLNKMSVRMTQSRTRCICETRMPPAATIIKSDRNSYILTCATPGHSMSVKCEKLLNEVTVRVWELIWGSVLIYLRSPKGTWLLLDIGWFVLFLFTIQTLNIVHFIFRLDDITDRQRDGWTDRLLDAPKRPFKPGA